MYIYVMETQIKSEWRERLHAEFLANGLGAMLDVATKRIDELESALKEAEEVARQAVNLYEQSK